MSYATKYKLEWIDYFGQAAELLIEEQGYGGASSDIKGTRSPISLTYDTPSDFLFEPINGSSMTIRLIAQTDFQFSDLYTANNRKYRITLNIDSSLFWQGYLLPDQYQEEYKGPPYVNEFIAADQLGYLKTLAWDDLGLTSPINDIQYLEHILGATDLDLDLQEGVNVYETNHNSTSADSPLDQTYIDVNIFDGKTYYEILYQILFKYNAILKQRAGEWFIYRPREATASYNLRKWTYSVGAFTYASVQSYNPIVSTTSATVAEASLVRISPNGKMFIQPAWKKYTLIHNMGLRKSFLTNYNFIKWTGNLPDNWYAVDTSGSLSYSRIGNGLRIQAQASGPPTDYIYQAIAMDDASQYQVMELSFDFDVFLGIGRDVIVYIEVFFNNPGTKWFEPDSTSWSSTQKYITKSYDNSGGGEVIQQNEKLNFTSPQITGFSYTGIWCRLFTPLYGSGSSQDAVTFNEARLTLMSRPTSIVVKSFDEETNYSDTIDADNNYAPDDMVILATDAPTASYPNAGEIWDGILFSDGAKNINTYEWTADGRTDTLIGLMQNNFTDIFQYPQQVLSVRIYTKLIDSCTVLQEINNTTASNKYFMIKRATWEAQAGYWEVEAHELPFAVGTSRIQLETEDYILLEDGSKIIRE